MPASPDALSRRRSLLGRLVLGSPVIFPLVHECETRGICHGPPDARRAAGSPPASHAIMNRMQEVGFNSALIREMPITSCRESHPDLIRKVRYRPLSRTKARARSPGVQPEAVGAHAAPVQGANLGSGRETDSYLRFRRRKLFLNG
jgi:hypothetical protein